MQIDNEFETHCHKTLTTQIEEKDKMIGIMFKAFWIGLVVIFTNYSNQKVNAEF